MTDNSTWTTTAGELASAQIGRRIRVAAESGVIVEDVLAAITFERDGRASGAQSDEMPAPRVWLTFENVRPGGGRTFAIQGIWEAAVNSGAFSVAADSVATVV